MLKLSHDQKKAQETLLDWYKSKKKSQFITLGGYAGTGKTTLVALFRKIIRKKKKKEKVAFVSFTGKAARVLRIHLAHHKALMKNDFVGTIHSLIYAPITNDKEEIIGWEKKKSVPYNLIIVDEASMVNQEIWHDLISYQIPIIAVGDHGQLPPIQGTFNLMEKPMIRLEEIHRQAQGSPIITVSILARERGFIPAREYGKNVKKIIKSKIGSGEEIEELLNGIDEDALVLCGYNHTRVKLNTHIRNETGFESQYPEVGDRVICLRNNHLEQIYNGMIGTIESIEDDQDKEWYDAKIIFNDDNQIYKGLISKNQFNALSALNFTSERKTIMKGDLFDFGYALTVHKAQGSQAKKVILFEERFKQMDDEMWARWLYTAVTRAEKELFIISN